MYRSDHSRKWNILRWVAGRKHRLYTFLDDWSETIPIAVWRQCVCREQSGANLIKKISARSLAKAVNNREWETGNPIGDSRSDMPNPFAAT